MARGESIGVAYEVEDRGPNLANVCRYTLEEFEVYPPEKGKLVYKYSRGFDTDNKERVINRINELKELGIKTKSEWSMAIYGCKGPALKR